VLCFKSALGVWLQRINHELFLSVSHHSVATSGYRERIVCVIFIINLCGHVWLNRVEWFTGSTIFTCKSWFPFFTIISWRTHNMTLLSISADTWHPKESFSTVLMSRGRCVGAVQCVESGRFDLKMGCLRWFVLNDHEGTDPEQHTQHVLTHDWIFCKPIIWWLQRGYTQTIVLSYKKHQYFRNFDFISHLTVMSVCKQVCIGTEAW